MNVEQLAVYFGAAVIAGFIHSSLGMGFGMIAMATTTLFVPYNNAAAVVSVALLVLVFQISISLRKYIDWKEIIMPSIVLTIGKAIGIVLMMHLQSKWLRISLGVFLVVYSITQLLDIKAMRIKGTPLQAAIFCGLGGFFGGVFNVSGPAAAIYCQARYGYDPKRYAANMNCIFAPSAIVALAMHIWYGNFNADAVVGSAAMVVAVLISAAVGVSVLKKINAKNMRKLSYIYIIIMGAVICISG